MHSIKKQSRANTSLSCPLCSRESGFLCACRGRDYHICGTCDLVFVSPQDQISFTQEKERYLEHNNNPDDEGYQRFLNPVAEAVLLDHHPPACGLDFGCGTGSPLPGMLTDHGFEMDVYDPFFAPHEEIFMKEYDFITCTEVAEHMRGPGKEIFRLWDMLKAGGGLYIKTELRDASINFSDWYYIKDPTHIAFYSKDTMSWLAKALGAGLIFPGDNVTRLLKHFNNF
jgi:hypothetical protein